MIAERLAAVAQRVASAAERSGRSPSEIEVIAVSKRQPAELIVAAYEAGHREFGENRAQELIAHVGLLPPDASWHMIGHLQRNKAKAVGPLVSVLHSLDSERLATTWAAATVPPPPVYVQVNLALEEQKGGIIEADLESLLARCATLDLTVRGLMILPPRVTDPEESRPWFRRMRALRDLHRDRYPNLCGLSMGMSGDFEVAIEEGSTAIRLGTTIFGPRLQ